MGQKLNIEIKLNNTTLASCYWKWSAYTTQAFYHVYRVIEYITIPCFQKNNSMLVSCSPLTLAINALQYAEGSLDDDELMKYPFIDVYPLSNLHNYSPININPIAITGDIAITPRSISDFRDHTEYNIEIHSDTQRVYFDVFHIHSSTEKIQQILEQYDITNEKELEKIPNMAIDYTNFSFNEFKDIISQQYLNDFFFNNDLIISNDKLLQVIR